MPLEPDSIRSPNSDQQAALLEQALRQTRWNLALSVLLSQRAVEVGAQGGGVEGQVRQAEVPLACPLRCPYSYPGSGV
jgi:hypothetical protein